MLAVANMEETDAFCQSVLAFTPTVMSPDYSIVEGDGQTIHFMRAASEEVMKCVPGHAEIYIEVEGIEYGMTEFHIGDPNECLVFVGQRTKRTSVR